MSDYAKSKYIAMLAGQAASAFALSKKYPGAGLSERLVENTLWSDELTRLRTVWPGEERVPFRGSYRPS